MPHKWPLLRFGENAAGYLMFGLSDLIANKNRAALNWLPCGSDQRDACNGVYPRKDNRRINSEGDVAFTEVKAEKKRRSYTPRRIE
jgi:hypothetical protein